MDIDKSNYFIAEKIADIFQTYAHIALEQDRPIKKIVFVDLFPKSLDVRFDVITDNNKILENKEVSLVFKNEEEFEDVMSDLKSIEKKLDEILKEIRK